VSGLRLLAAAATPALRRAVFGGDDDLDEGGLRAALALSEPTPAGDALSGATARDLGGRSDAWLCAPSQAALQTARALGHDDPVVEVSLADPDYGRWAGLGLGDVAGTEPDGLQAWLTDPAAAPHGGESLAAVRQRVGGWLDRQAEQRAVAVAHPVIVRAALAHALDLPDQAVWRLDVAPLSLTRLTHRANRWHLSFPPTA